MAEPKIEIQNTTKKQGYLHARADSTLIKKIEEYRLIKQFSKSRAIRNLLEKGLSVEKEGVEEAVL